MMILQSRLIPSSRQLFIPQTHQQNQNVKLLALTTTRSLAIMRSGIDSKTRPLSPHVYVYFT
jgi:hypothetical protein